MLGFVTLPNKLGIWTTDDTRTLLALRQTAILASNRGLTARERQPDIASPPKEYGNNKLENLGKI